MRHIRSVRPLSDTSFFPQFQQCHLNKTSSAPLHSASSLQNDGRSYATFASPDVIQDRKPLRRVSKKERKSMVEHFVKKYREANGGKFPSVSDAKKVAGGSYYTVRDILQELMYNSKQPLVDTIETMTEKSTKRKDEISSNVREDVETSNMGEVTRSTSKDNIGFSSSNILENQGQQSSVLVEASIRDRPTSLQQTDESEDRTRFHPQIDKPESSKLPNPENNIIQEKSELQRDSTETLERAQQKVSTEDAERNKNPSIWNNLKSFANGILSLWNRS